MTCYHIGEGINSLHKVSLIPGGSEVLVYTTLSGSIGILVPFSSKEVHTHTLIPVNNLNTRG